MMYLINARLSLLISLFLTSNCVQCFVVRPSGASLVINKVTSSKTNLQVSMPLLTDEEINESMRNARECALSDSCSIDDAKQYLNEVLYVQGACTAGTLTDKDLCDGNQDVIAETVALLREKSNATKSSVAISQMINNPMMTGSLSFTLLCAFVIVLSTISINPETTPFTYQEWYYAVKGGYVDDMISHYFRNGGL